MPAERAQAPRDDEEDGYEPSYASASAVSVSSPLESGEAAGPVAAGTLGSVVMIGTHFHSLDEKGRVIIPAKMRAALTEQFWMMLDEDDNIRLYPYATGMDILEHCERMIAEDPDNEDTAAAVMRITEAADLVAVESTFRVLLPDILRFRAGMDKEVVTVGALNHAVLWGRERWEESQASKPITVEVRKVQASLMRAAASGARRADQDEAARRAEESARERALEQAHQRGLELDAERRIGRGERGGGRKTASSGDGGRSPGVLKISDLGR